MRPADYSGTYRAYNPAWPRSEPRPWRAGRGALVVYTLVILYASLNPFVGWRAPEIFTIFSWPKYLTFFDVALNVVAYAPLGALWATLLAAYWRRQDDQLPLQLAKKTRLAWLFAVLIAGSLSALMEFVQAFLPGRVSSSADLLANTVGAAIGAAFIVSRLGQALLERLERWRFRHFAAGEYIDWGLLLIGLWIFAQLNPAIPFFGAGSVVGHETAGVINPINTADRLDPYDPLFLLPQAVGVALNVCGFALFIALLLHPAKKIWNNIWIVLLIGFVAKVSMAALLLKAPQMIAWMGPATVIGIIAGLLTAALFSRFSQRKRAFAATLFVFAGGVMAKISSIYAAFDETLRLFNWPYGQLINFASLTSWVNEVWPLIAFIYLAIVFIRYPRRH